MIYLKTHEGVLINHTRIEEIPEGVRIYFGPQLVILVERELELFQTWQEQPRTRPFIVSRFGGVPYGPEKRSA